VPGSRCPESGVRLLQRDQVGPVTVTASVTVTATVPESGARVPGSGVRLLQRDQVGPVTVTASVLVTAPVPESSARVPVSGPGLRSLAWFIAPRVSDPAAGSSEAGLVHETALDRRVE